MTELPDGLTTRPATIQDAGAITALVTGCERDADGVAEIDREDVIVDFGRSGFDPRWDTVLVFEDHELVACAEFWRGRAQADVRPDQRGRGIGTWILGWTERRARELDAPTVGQTVTDANSAAIELFGRNGYAPRFTSWILETRMDEGPPPGPAFPSGIRVRAFEPRRDGPEVFRLIDDAFNEWPEREEPWPYEDWRTLVVDRPSFEAEASPLALDGDEIVGAALCLDVPDEGWIQQLATKATHRHRGIARALLLHAFGKFHALGKPTCLSTDSRTGALGLYEKVGMHVRRSYTRYSKQLT